MKRRQFFQLLLCAAAVPPTHESPTPLAPAECPLHECIDRPELPCPACEKWTGDPFASVRHNPTILSA
jgi:hypothetical protein